jgi:hypothetical protein
MIERKRLITISKDVRLISLQFNHKSQSLDIHIFMRKKN